MYSNDEFTNNSNGLPSIPREITTYSHQIINPTLYDISSNLTKLLPNFHPNYHPYLDLASSNTSHALSPNNNSSINPILGSNNQDILIKENDEEQEEIKSIRRMISNRESARRSRLRKRKQLDNLQHQVFQLLTTNHQLADKLNQVMESNYQILQENAQLKQDAASLQKNVNDLIMSMKGGLEKGSACNHNGVFIRASQTITRASITSTSMDVLQ